MQASITLLGVVCLVSVAGALAIVAQHLRKKPALSFATKITLLFGLGVFPASAAVSSTVTGMEATTHRTFCGSCHSMDAYVADADDPLSQSMAARHGRNPYFGDHNCYTCHADYGMLGYPLTKLNGMRHVYEYYLGGWRNKTPEQTLTDIHLQKPYRDKFGFREGMFPIAESAGRRSLALPFHTRLTEREVEMVAQTLEVMIRREDLTRA